MRGRCPLPSDYDSVEEYNEACDAYEYAEYWAIEEKEECDHER